MNDTPQRQWPWSILDIDATADPAQIKAAYAARLRVTRPDDDPEGFQHLRQARDAAMALAADPAAGPTTTEAETAEGATAETPDPGPIRDGLSDADATGPQDAREAGPADLPQALSERLQAFLASPWAKSDPRRWRQLFEDLPILDASRRAMLERSLARQLDAWLDGEPLPDPAIVMVLNDEFGWDASGSSLDEILDRPNVARIRTIISSLKR